MAERGARVGVDEGVLDTSRFCRSSETVQRKTLVGVLRPQMPTKA
jgi:hypothetical protein